MISILIYLYSYFYFYFYFYDLYYLYSKCKAFGATVHLFGENIAEAKEYATKIGDEKGLLYVNGYDDPAIISGAGTMGLEIMEQIPDADAVIIPIGGAGLIAGNSIQFIIIIINK